MRALLLLLRCVGLKDVTFMGWKIFRIKNSSWHAVLSDVGSVRVFFWTLPVSIFIMCRRWSDIGLLQETRPDVTYSAWFDQSSVRNFGVLGEFWGAGSILFSVWLMMCIFKHQINRIPYRESSRILNSSASWMKDVVPINNGRLLFSPQEKCAEVCVRRMHSLWLRVDLSQWTGCIVLHRCKRTITLPH